MKTKNELNYRDNIRALQEQCKTSFTAAMESYGYTVQDDENTMRTVPDSTAKKKGYVSFRLVLYPGAIAKNNPAFAEIQAFANADMKNATALYRIYKSPGKPNEAFDETKIVDRFWCALDEMKKYANIPAQTTEYREF